MADDEPTCGFRINTEYARKYNTWREKEELQKLKDRFGDTAENDDSSTSESEDEDAEGLTSKVEKDWLRTFAAVKTRNPKIYDKSVNFFNNDEDDEEIQKPKTVKTSSMYLKDYERKVILEKGGVVSESEEDEEQTHAPGYYKEQEEIKNSLVRAVQEDDGVSDDEDLLVKRPKTTEEKEKEDIDYLEWLKGQKPDLDEEVKTDLAPLKEMWSDPKLDEGDKFLRDYILNKRYLEDDEEDRFPTYDEITREEDLSGDELLIEKQETFERKFNFRFEEPDAEFIKSYPRTLGDGVRRKDDRRTKKRAELKKRKEKEKAKKGEELKQLKNMKRREIMTKVEQLKQITGNDTIGISEADLEGDFDPTHYDKLMEKVFNEDYYDDEDDEKPTFEDDEELGIECENWDEWTGPEQAESGGGNWDPSTAGTSQEGQGEYEPGCEDPDFNMDADYDPTADRNFGLDGRTNKSKKKSKFKLALEKEKPQFDPNQKSFEEYLDEYYKLDYEDMIGDIPCRFKYRQVAPNDYGLSVDEVLKCDDKELNTWVSLKKMSQYRTEEDENYERRLYSKKARNIQKKLNVLHSLAESEEDEEVDEPEERKESNTTKKKRRKKRKREEALTREMSNPTSFQNQPQGASHKKDVKDGKKSIKATQSPGDGVPKKKARLVVMEASAPLQEEVTKALPSEEETTTVISPVASTKGQDNSDIVKAKKKVPKKPKRQGPGVMSDERLKAFGINPKKFKYTHLPKIKEKRKRDKQSQKNSAS